MSGGQRGDAGGEAAGVAATSLAWIAAAALSPRAGQGAPGQPPPADADSHPRAAAEGAAAAVLPAGQWGSPADLALPLDDRGLLLADGLFETVLVEEGRPRLLAEHLARWQRSAELLGMACPPAAATLEPLIAEAVARSGIRGGALRLNWSRGGGGRGLELPEPGGERFWLQLSAWQPRFTAVAVIVSASERRCATSLLSRCKTFAYGSAIEARRQAHGAGADDALLESSAGGLCCATAATLLLRRDGRWLTPPLASGCLPGVMRQRALQLGLAAEANGPLAAEALRNGTIGEALLLNSLGCRPLRSCDGAPLAPLPPGEAEAFWRSLL